MQARLDSITLGDQSHILASMTHYLEQQHHAVSSSWQQRAVNQSLGCIVLCGLQEGYSIIAFAITQLGM